MFDKPTIQIGKIFKKVLTKYVNESIIIAV